MHESRGDEKLSTGKKRIIASVSSVTAGIYVSAVNGGFRCSVVETVVFLTDSSRTRVIFEFWDTEGSRDTVRMVGVF